MIYEDIADYVGPTENCNPGGMTGHKGLVLHIEQGTEAGSIAWGKNPASQISFHFGGPKAGRLQQLVDTDDRAWAEAGGNSEWISLENEGRSGDLLTPNQVANAAILLARLNRDYGVPLAISDSPDTPGLGYHAMGGEAWGNHPDCPGSPIIGQRHQIISAATSLLRRPPIYPGVELRQGSTGGFVQEMQARLIARGYSCGPWGADGDFGRATAAAVGQFQLQHPACKSTRTNGQPDEIVGPNTWTVLFS